MNIVDKLLDIGCLFVEQNDDIIKISYLPLSKMKVNINIKTHEISVIGSDHLNDFHSFEWHKNYAKDIQDIINILEN